MEGELRRASWRRHGLATADAPLIECDRVEGPADCPLATRNKKPICIVDGEEDVGRRSRRLACEGAPLRHCDAIEGMGWHHDTARADMPQISEPVSAISWHIEREEERGVVTHCLPRLARRLPQRALPIAAGRYQVHSPLAARVDDTVQLGIAPRAQRAATKREMDLGANLHGALCMRCEQRLRVQIRDDRVKCEREQRAAVSAPSSERHGDGLLLLHISLDPYSHLVRRNLPE